MQQSYFTGFDMSLAQTPETSHGSLEFPIRVYYEDTDAGGVVYYANYLRFCERARTEWLRAMGLEQQRLLVEQNIGFVVKSVTAEYRAPARLDDMLRVVSRILDWRPASLNFEQQIWRGPELLFDSRIIIACINTAKGRPTAVPAELRAKRLCFL